MSRISSPPETASRYPAAARAALATLMALVALAGLIAILSLGSTSVNAAPAQSPEAVVNHPASSLVEHLAGWLPRSTSALTTSTTTVITLAPNPSIFGNPVTLRATVSGGSGTPTGVVFFNDGGVTIGTATLSETAPGVAVADLVAYDLLAGVHEISAVYQGDDVYAASTSGIYNHTVNRRPVDSVTLTSSANPSVFGQTVTFTATVSSGIPVTPTGQVLFRDGGTVIGEATLDGSGRAVVSTADLEVSPPAHSITADYLGDQNFLPSTGNLSQTVDKADTISVVTDVTVNPSVYGQSITFTAAVHPVPPGSGTPTGKVFFEVDSKRVFTGTLGFTNPGEVRWSNQPGDITELDTVGSPHAIRVFYEGDVHFNLSDNTVPPFGPFPQTVNRAQTSVRVTDPITQTQFGQEVTINATVQVEPPGSGTSTGDVRFFVQSTGTTHTLALPQGSTSVSFRTRDLPIGQNPIDVQYLGDVHFLPSPTETVTHTVEKTDSETTLVSSLNPSTFGETVTFTATVEPAGVGLFAPITPTGTVTFTFGNFATVTRTLNGSGVATVVSDTLPAGTFNVTADYGADNNFFPSDDLLVQTVNRLETSTTLDSSASPGNTSEINQPVFFTATVTSTLGIVPTGTVSFKDGGGFIGSNIVLNGAGQASISHAFTTGGPHTIQAVYNGTPNFESSSSAKLTHQVTAAATGMTLVSSAPGDTSVFGQTVTFTATVSSASGTPTGNVTFKDGGTTLGSVTLDGAGQATFSTSSLAVGTHAITANYSGSPQFNANSASISPFTVNKANVTVTITSDNPDASVVGQPVVVQYTVTATPPGSGTPTGNVTVSDGTDSCIGTVAAGQCTLTPTTAGSKTLTATYAGDTRFNTNSGTEAHQVNPAGTSTSVTSVPNPSLINESVTITATVTSEPASNAIPTGGNVLFTASDGSLNTTGPLVNGIASVNHTFTVIGTFTISATYQGDGSNFSPSPTATTSHIVGDKPTDLAVTKTDSPDPVNAGDNLTYVVTVSNNGPEDATVTLTDTLPPGVTFVSATPSTPTCTQSAGTVTCNLGNIPNGGSTTVAIIVIVPGSTPAGTVLVNKATVTGSRPDSNPSNNTATQETTVFRSPRMAGDCNGDDDVNRNDIFSIVRGIFDPSYRGAAGCDANDDTRVDAGDVPCTVLIMFNGTLTCSAGAAQTSPAEPATLGPVLALDAGVPATPGIRTPIPVRFTPNGHAISSVAFSVDYDEAWLSFDPTDNNGDSIPDAVTLNLPGDFEATVDFDPGDRDGELDIVIADTVGPLAELPEGIIAYVMLDVESVPAVAEGAVQFSAAPTTSFGDVDGRSVPGTATPTRQGRYRIYAPLVLR